MTIDIQTFLSWVPKLAGTFLVILGILIILEIKGMTKKKTPVVEKKVPEILPTVKFPQTGVKVEVHKKTQVPTRRILFVIFAVFLFTTILFTGYRYLSGWRLPQLSTNKEISSTPATQPESKPQVIIYRINDGGEWRQIPLDELQSLSAGTEIQIAVAATFPIKSASFIVNDELLSSKPSLNPFGEPYVSYTIREDISNYHIAVSIRE